MVDPGDRVDLQRELVGSGPPTATRHPVVPKTGPVWPDTPPFTRYMAAGLLRADGTWLGLLSPSHLDGAYRAGQWLRAVESATDTPRDTRLMRGELAPLDVGDDASHRRIRAMAPIGELSPDHAVELEIAAIARSR